VRHDIPAALPLTGLIAGLALTPLILNPIQSAAGIALILLILALHDHRAARAFASVALALIAGMLLVVRSEHRTAKEAAQFAALGDETFVLVEAPIERDWAPRENSFLLRTSGFRANAHEFEKPLAVYMREAPPRIRLESRVRIEGFLRLDEEGNYSVSVKSPRLLTYEGGLRWWEPSRWNRALAQRLERHAGQHPDEVALAEALVLGRGERLSEEMRDSFRHGGTYHLLVFSGMQIAFAAGILAALLRWMHRPRASDWLLLGFALLAPPFIGPTASVARASTGIGLYALSRLFKRPTSVPNLWCVAAILRLLIAPGDIADPAFHLTYAGAGALLFIGSQFRHWLAHVVAAEIVITPLTLFHFHQYALGGALLTLLISPAIFGMLVLSAIALAAPTTPVFAGIRALHRLCLFANQYGFSGVFTAPPLASLIAGAALALVALATLNGKRRALALTAAMILPIGSAVATHLALRDVRDPRVTFLDVGQGDAIAIRSGTHTILVDGGRDSRILELLAGRGIRRIDAVVLTHAHPDHCGGLEDVIDRFGAGVVWLSPWRFRGDCAQRMLDACAAAQTPIHLIRDGDELTLGGVEIVAQIADRNFRRSPENNSSVVLRVSAGGRRFLLMGDAEKEAEHFFLDRDLRADVLKVGHHGSRSSTGDAFLDAVAPRLAVISCGRHNLFGHPHGEVLDSLSRRGIPTLRTDRDRSIDIEVRAGKLYVRRGND
jgi:competence protein ComEC